MESPIPFVASFRWTMLNFRGSNGQNNTLKMYFLLKVVILHWHVVSFVGVVSQKKTSTFQTTNIWPEKITLKARCQLQRSRHPPWQDQNLRKAMVETTTKMPNCQRSNNPSAWRMGIQDKKSWYVVNNHGWLVSPLSIGWLWDPFQMA